RKYRQPAHDESCYDARLLSFQRPDCHVIRHDIDDVSRSLQLPQPPRRRHEI
ncbi:hypothetical protein LTR94_038040, partial [Friedmanniomyces endolithicus]